MQADDEPLSRPVKPRIIIHGGCGNITPANLPPTAWLEYKASLLRILQLTTTLLSEPSTTALDAAVHAVELLQFDPLFNAGYGAVFDRSGHVELEASVMLSRGSRKRGAAVSMIKHVKSPVGLAREVLLKGEETGGGGAQGHVHLCGKEVENLAETWGLDMCEENYFWTRKRWEEHRRGLERERGVHQKLVDAPGGFIWPEGDPGWDELEYLPQGTVGCVVLDSFGTLCVATSTGGITNKIPGRIGDTPTFGAGFWAEEWRERRHHASSIMSNTPSFLGTLHRLPVVSTLSELARPIAEAVASCFPAQAHGTTKEPCTSSPLLSKSSTHAVAMSGTGNGDSFLQLAAVGTCAARARFGKSSLAEAVTWMAGPNGELQQSAGDRWHKSGEGEGGIIGIEMVDGAGKVVWDFNCGGMFRTWIDDDDAVRVGVFRQTEGVV